MQLVEKVKTAISVMAFIGVITMLVLGVVIMAIQIPAAVKIEERCR